MIGIKGTRGIGKTTFLLQYAKEHFDIQDRKCLYINMNNFYFHGRGIADFAGEFYRKGGRVLLIDQVFKQPDWSQELRKCYDLYTNLKIVFTGSSVMRLKDENPELNGIVKSYNLRGFSFREFINLLTGNDFRPYTLEEILNDHEHIIKKILPKVSPNRYFQDYIHHGFYPFFQEQSCYGNELHQVPHRCPSTEYDLPFGRRFSQEAVKGDVAQLQPALRYLPYPCGQADGYGDVLRQFAVEGSQGQPTGTRPVLFGRRRAEIPCMRRREL